MPRNGSGTYSLPGNSINPAVTGTTIESSAFNTTLPDLAAALTQSLSKDGQTVPTGNLPMGGFKLTSLADGSGAADSATYGQTLHSTGGNTIVGNQALSGDLAINGNTVLSGNLTVTGTVIFTISTLALETLGVSSAASVTSLTITGKTNANTLAVASTASLNTVAVSGAATLNTLAVSSTAAIAVLSVASSIVVGAASGGSKGAGTINATAIYVNGQIVTGKAVQTVNFKTGSVLTATSAAIPFDNSIPQITEGDQYLSVSITPTSATNNLYIRALLNVSFGTNAYTLTGALFQGATANAICASSVYAATANTISQIELEYYGAAGTTSSTAFTVRAGPEGLASTFTVNGINGAGKLGGVLLSSITITEYAP